MERQQPKMGKHHATATVYHQATFAIAPCTSRLRLVSADCKEVDHEPSLVLMIAQPRETNFG